MASVSKNKDQSDADQVKDSKSYQKAKSKAQQYANDPDKLNDLIDKASSKAKGKEGPLNAVWSQLMACFVCLRAPLKTSADMAAGR